MHGPLLVCKGSQEGPAYIIHAVHAHGRTLEDAAAGEDVSGAKGSNGAWATLPTASHTSPGCGEDSIEQWGPAISRGQQEHVLCREGTTLGEGAEPGSRVCAPVFTAPTPSSTPAAYGKLDGIAAATPMHSPILYISLFILTAPRA